MVSMMFQLFSFCLFMGGTAMASNFRHGSVYCQEKWCEFKPDVLDWEKATAVGSFNDTLAITGWGILDISAGHAKNATADNNEIMYAAGFIEGVFTARHMDNQFKNTRNALLPFGKKKEMTRKIRRWLAKNREWTKKMVEDHQHEDPLWRHIGYVLSQFDGLMDGYNSVSKNVSNPLDVFALSYLNGLGDFMDIELSLKEPDEMPDWQNYTEDDARKNFRKNAHCSVLVKLLPGMENMLMSHATEFDYRAMNRIFKHYDFQLDDPNTVHQRLSFSSYPGNLESIDDFYLIGGKMVMLQTSLEVYDHSLYAKVKPQSLMAWQRVRVANMVARNGEEWADVIDQYNSGTYNNEYIVVDLTRFTPKEPLRPGTVWVVDQMPGLVGAQDVTEVLNSGYFPSYNIPFVEEVYNKIGAADYAKRHGAEFSYTLEPRAKIFRRDQAKVRTLQDMKAIMRYNDYENDPYSEGNPDSSICARSDLNQDGDPSGCFDAKVVDWTMAKALQAHIINGPTLGNDLPPFSWTGRFDDEYSHVGLPTTFNFTFVRTEPRFP